MRLYYSICLLNASSTYSLRRGGQLPENSSGNAVLTWFDLDQFGFVNSCLQSLAVGSKPRGIKAGGLY